MARPPLALLAGLAACGAVPFVIGALGAQAPVPGEHGPAAVAAPAVAAAPSTSASPAAVAAPAIATAPAAAASPAAVTVPTASASPAAAVAPSPSASPAAVVAPAPSAGPAVAVAPAAVPEAEPPAILVSRQLAAAEGLQPGDVVRLSTEPSGAGARPFRIAGTYEPTPDPMRVMSARHEARFHLPDLLALTGDPTDPLGDQSADAINIALADPADAHAFASDLRAQIPGLLVEPTARDTGPTSTFAVIERFHVAVAVVTVVASSLFLLALMVMRVNERRETVGTLRLLGVPTRRLLLHVVAEGLAVAVAGALFGLLLAVAFEDAFNRFFQWRYDTALVFVRITPAVALRSVALAVPMGLLASLAASWPLLRAGALTLVRR